MQRVVAQIQDVHEVRVAKRLGVHDANGVGLQREPMDVFDVAQRERLDRGELPVGLDAQLAQMRQMPKRVRLNDGQAGVNDGEILQVNQALCAQLEGRGGGAGERLTWKSFVLIELSAGLSLRMKRVTACVNGVKL